MYCKLCGKWLEGSAMLCEDCARRQAAASPAPGVPETAAPEMTPPAPPIAAADAAAPAGEQAAAGAQAAKNVSPAQAAKNAAPAQPPKVAPSVPRPPYYGMYVNPADEKPLNGCAIGGFVLSIVDLLPMWIIGIQFAQEGDMLYRFLFLFLPMVIFQSIAIILSAIGIRTRKGTRGGTFAKVGMLVSVVGLVMFLEMFIAGLILLNV